VASNSRLSTAAALLLAEELIRSSYQKYYDENNSSFALAGINDDDLSATIMGSSSTIINGIVIEDERLDYTLPLARAAAVAAWTLVDSGDGTLDSEEGYDDEDDYVAIVSDIIDVSTNSLEGLIGDQLSGFQSTKNPGWVPSTDKSKYFGLDTEDLRKSVIASLLLQF
jgi:hypothetical protein